MKNECAILIFMIIVLFCIHVFAQYEVPANMNQNSDVTEIDKMILKNRQKFSAIKVLNLPIDQYAITGSGVLGIRNLREIGDIDIIVTPKLWDKLVEKYGITDENHIKKIVFPGKVIEALGEESFYAEKKDKNFLTIVDRIANAEFIDGLPFERLEHVLYYKRKMGREKDLKDIILIENALNEKPIFEVRALINDLDQVKKKLISLNAILKGEYEFKDYIYSPNRGEYDLNREFVRLRVYQKTNWDQKPVELSYKIKNFPNLSGKSLLKKQFASIKEAEEFLKQHEIAFSYSRNGFEYQLNDIKIYVEAIENLAPSIEIVSNSKEKMDQIFEHLTPVQILADSVPQLIKNRLLHLEESKLRR